VWGAGWIRSRRRCQFHRKVDFINQKIKKENDWLPNQCSTLVGRQKQALKFIGNSGTDGGKASFESGLSKLSALYNKVGPENPMLKE